MPKNTTKLELTWIGKDQRPRLEPRILLEDPEKSYHANERVSDQDIFDNRLIFGDNLLALKSLEQEYSGQVKCIYIDPPFNTGEAFENYDDNLEHSIWLSLIRSRLELLCNLLSPDGSIFVHIGEKELGSLIALLDEELGRENRVALITFKQGSATGHKSINPGLVTVTNYVLAYAKNKDFWRPNRLYTERSRDTRYSQYIVNIESDYSEWYWVPLSKAVSERLNIPARKLKAHLGSQYASFMNSFVLENAERVIRTARPDYNSVGKEVKEAIDASTNSPSSVIKHARSSYSDMYFKSGERLLFYKDKLKNVDGEWVSGEPLTNLWDDLLSNNLHKEGGVKFPKGKKPEFLIKRIFDLATTPGDLVLDSFAGSGTTGAVAQKMGRQWIMVELGEHCHSHIIPRLKAVIDGKDNSGVTNAMNWKGGGGFRYYRLAPSLLTKDRWDNWVISPEYDAAMLAQAMCKHEGFTYAPDPEIWWNQGHATEKDFIYVTTQTLTHEQLSAIHQELDADQSLLICCSAFRAYPDAFERITLKKIPHAVLGQCEFGRDDYSLEVANLPYAEPDPVSVDDLFAGDDA